MLTLTPFGIVLSLVLLNTEGAGALNRTAGGHGFAYDSFVLLLLALLSFIGLFRAVIVLARQQHLEQQSMLAEINRSYYESMEQQHFAIRRVKSRAQKGLFCLEVTNPVGSVEKRLQNLETGTEKEKERTYGGDKEERTYGGDGEERNRKKEKEQLPPTAKADKENHGFGLRSMKEIVERNHGAMEIGAEEGIYEVFLYMTLG